MKWCLPLFALLVSSCASQKGAGAADASSGDLPLVRLSDGYYVRLDLGGGKTGLFLVDSGSDDSYVTVKGYALLKAAGAAIHPDETIEARNPAIGGYPVVSPRFRPWGANQDTMAEASDGILGLDFLECYRVGLCFPEKRMRLWRDDVDMRGAPADWLDRASGRPPDGSRRKAYLVRLKTHEGRLFTAPVRFDGSTVNAVVDTGSDDSFVSATTARSLGWSYEKRESKTSFFDGPTKLRFHEIRTVSIGGIQLDGRHLLAVTQNDRNLSLVGLDALAPLSMLLDVDGKRMVVAWTYEHSGPRS